MRSRRTETVVGTPRCRCVSSKPDRKRASAATLPLFLSLYFVGTFRDRTCAPIDSLWRLRVLSKRPSTAARFGCGRREAAKSRHSNILTFWTRATLTLSFTHSLGSPAHFQANWLLLKYKRASEQARERALERAADSVVGTAPAAAVAAATATARGRDNRGCCPSRVFLCVQGCKRRRRAFLPSFLPSFPSCFLPRASTTSQRRTKEAREGRKSSAGATSAAAAAIAT